MVINVTSGGAQNLERLPLAILNKKPYKRLKGVLKDLGKKPGNTLTEWALNARMVMSSWTLKWTLETLARCPKALLKGCFMGLGYKL